MSETNRALVERFWETLYRRDYDGVGAFFAPDGRERPAFRLVGYANTADFAARLAAFEQAE